MGKGTVATLFMKRRVTLGQGVRVIEKESRWGSVAANIFFSIFRKIVWNARARSKNKN